jgi:hypothetical protein
MTTQWENASCSSRSQVVVTSPYCIVFSPWYQGLPYPMMTLSVYFPECWWPLPSGYWSLQVFLSLGTDLKPLLSLIFLVLYLGVLLFSVCSLSVCRTSMKGSSHRNRKIPREEGLGGNLTSLQLSLGYSSVINMVSESALGDPKLWAWLSLVSAAGQSGYITNATDRPSTPTANQICSGLYRGFQDV